jgi:hypothetical protein
MTLDQIDERSLRSAGIEGTVVLTSVMYILKMLTTAVAMVERYLLAEATKTPQSQASST